LKYIDDHKGKKVIFITARIHQGEVQGSWMAKGIIDFLIGNYSDSRILRSNFIFVIIPMLNIDGVRYGNHRCSIIGNQIIRNWFK